MTAPKSSFPPWRQIDTENLQHAHTFALQRTVVSPLQVHY